MDILFDKLLVVSSFCLRKIGNLVGFIIGVVIHPIKNIAIWITLLLSSFLIVGNVSIQLEGKDIAAVNLQVMDEVGEAGIFGKAWDWLVLTVKGLFA